MISSISTEYSMLNPSIVFWTRLFAEICILMLMSQFYAIQQARLQTAA